MPKDSQLTQDRIVAAAVRLFYGEGIRAVSVDTVAEKAGVTKKTFYYHFKSKDELIAAYLECRDQPTLALYARWYAETEGSAAEKIKGLFSNNCSVCGHASLEGMRIPSHDSGVGKRAWASGHQSSSWPQEALRGLAFGEAVRSRRYEWWHHVIKGYSAITPRLRLKDRVHTPN